MRDLRVYIVEKNVLVRQMIAKIIGEYSNFTIAGMRSSEQFSIVRDDIYNSQPGVLLLGIDKVKSDEFKLFREVRRSFPSLPVIIVCPKSEKGAEVAIESLKNGALDFVTKPENNSTILLAENHLKKRLIHFLSVIPNVKTKLLKPVNRVIDRNASEKHHGLNVHRKVNPVDAAIIAGCTGGVSALYQVMSALPEDLPVPLFVIQHAPGIVTSYLAKDLNRISNLTVKEASDGEIVKKGFVYLAPGGYHLKIEGNDHEKVMELHRGPREQKSRPSADSLIRSLRRVYGNNLLVVVLSGAGRDGLLGVENLYSNGGQVIVQSRSSSLLWDLPGEITGYGLSDGELDTCEMGKEIYKRVLKSSKRTILKNINDKRWIPDAENYPMV